MFEFAICIIVRVPAGFMRLPTHLRRGVIVAAGVCAAIALTDLLLGPVYARGAGQPWISHLNGASSLLALPGFLVAVFTGVRTGHHTTPLAWGVILVVNFVMYTLSVAAASAVLGAMARKLHRKRVPDEANSDSPRPGVSRRRVIAAGLGAAAAGAVAYPLGVATRRFEVTRRTFPVPGLPTSLDGLRIVQLTDIHHGPWIPLSHVRDVVATANALDPDLVLLTGDYVHRSPVYIDPVADALAKLRASIGVLGILGNHDWWEDGPATKRAFNRVGIPLIDNDKRFVTPRRALVSHAPSDGLCVAGVGDYYEDDQDYDAALGGVPADMPRLLLSHNPDVAEDRAFGRSGLRVDLMLSGHTHGGQIYVPGLGTPIVPSRYGQKYARGLVQGPVCPVFVCRGVGHTILPMRVGIAPELAVIELRGV